MDGSYGRDLIMFALGALFIVSSLFAGAWYVLWRILR